MNKMPNLDFLRFFAASLVICQHIELYASSFFIDTSNQSILKVNSSFGVALFFVLSAFLITTLLLDEKQRASTISFKTFYWRRILRIWPLYYLIIFLGFFVFPHLTLFDIPFENKTFVQVEDDRLMPNVFFYLFSIPSMGRTLYGNIPYISQTWSLATEQIFYLIAPFVIEYFNKRLVFSMLVIVFLYFGISYFLVTKYADLIPYNQFILNFWMDFKLPSMVIGGIFSVMVYEKMQLVKFIFNPAVFLISTLLIIIIYIIGSSSAYDNPLCSVLLGIIVSNLACNKKFSGAFKNKLMNYLGSISYGIYMYHCIFIVVAIKLSVYFGLTWIIYPVTFLLTIVTSHYSYKYFEGYFLRFKTKFSNGERSII